MLSTVSKSIACLAVFVFCQLSAQSQISLAPTNSPSLPEYVSVAWDASPDATVVGYNIYYGTNSGVYTGKIDVSNSLSVTLDVTPPGVVYYIAVDAYDSTGQESPFSNEISYSAPVLAPQAPLVLSPNGPLAYGTTNYISTTGGSGTGAVSYTVLSGPGFLTADSNNLVVTAASGVILLKATKAADTVYLSTSVTNAISLTAASQIINFPPIPNQRQTNVVNLTATASSGLPVSFSVASGPGLISGTQLSFTGAGTVVVVASQPGNSFYYPAAPVSVSVTVTAIMWPNIALNNSALAFSAVYGNSNPAPQSLTLNNTGELPLTFTNSTLYGANASGWLVVTPSSGSVGAFASTNLSIGVKSSGLSAGTYYATNTIISAEATNSPVTWVARLTISPGTQSSLVFNPPSIQTYGTTNTLTLTGGSGSGAVSFSILSGPGVIIGGGTQLLATSGTGQIFVMATKAGDSNFMSATTSAVITASKASQTISFPAIPNQKSTNIVNLTATASSSLPVSFSLISGPAILTGNQLKFTGSGTVYVSANQAGDTNYFSAVSVTNSITVTPYLKAPGSFRIVSN